MYPFFEVPIITSGLVVAFIACFHILPCHLATGAFWFTAYVEREAFQKGRDDLYEFLEKFSLLILVFCFVIGSLSGVGIWFSTTVASPRGISGLIHNYVWGWATEWVFFLIEIATIYVYYYTLGRIDRRTHLQMGITYAWAAWISMVIITGILAFMLTSDKWIETGNFFDGFFNSTYWPQLFVRTALMFSIAGVYAMMVASRMKSRKASVEITRKAAAWGIGGLVLGGLFMLWFIQKLPPGARELALEGGLPYLKTLLYVAVGTSLVLLLYFVLFGLVMPARSGVAVGMAALLVLLAGIGAGEGFREGARRPYIISQYMYGNQVIGADLAPKGVTNETERYQEQGFLANFFWAQGLDREDPVQRRTIGRMIALYQCGNCHSFEASGILRPLPRLLGGLGLESPDDIAGFMDALGDYPYMPPFAGDDDDKALIGEYLYTLPGEGS